MMMLETTEGKFYFHEDENGNMQYTKYTCTACHDTVASHNRYCPNCGYDNLTKVKLK